MRSLSKGIILRRWLFSYLLILLIPLVGAYASYYYTRSVITDEIRISNQTALSGIITGVDDLLEQAKNAAESVLASQTLTAGLASQKDISSFLKQTPELVKLVANCQYPLCDSEILLYLPCRDYLINSYTANPLPRLASSVRLIRGTAEDEETYAETIRKTYFHGAFLYSAEYAYERHGKESIVYARSHDTGVSSANAGVCTVYVNVSLNRLAEHFAKVEDGIMLAFDRDGRPLFQWGITAPDADSLALNEPDESGTLTYYWDEQRYLGTSAVSEISGWTFVLLRPESRFWKNANYITTITVIFLSLSLLMGFAITFLLLRQNYKPVSQTLRSISPGYAGDPINEFEFIRDSYMTLMAAHQEIQNTVATQQETLRDSYLFSHLHGFHEQLADSDIQAFLNLDFDDKWFAVISFLIGSDAVPQQDMSAMDGSALEGNPLPFALDSLFMRAFVGSYTTYRLPKDHLYTWLVVLNADQYEDFISIATEKLTGIVARLHESFNTPVSALITDALNNFNSLPDAYQEILNLTHLQYVAGSEGVVHVSSCRKSGASRSEEDDLLLLSEAILSSRPGDASTVLKRLTARQEDSADASDWVFRLRAYGWAARMLDHEEIISRTDGSLLRKHLSALLSASVPAAVSKQLSQLVLLLCGTLPEPSSESDGGISQRVQSYIDTHYTDCNLSLSSIAEVFELSPQYLSRLYRAETESSLLEYIAGVRVQHAKALLENDQLTVAQVAEMVGYTNVKTFRRAFIRQEGATPRRTDEGSI